ncbi:MAG: FAD-dependent oxidoreductase, partial [Rhodospirillaceae bacterium]|nr:FAD-dependent oxidoreductase [Rhodospirillaceae bacterium]
MNAGTRGPEATHETLVIGGGIVGLTASWFLAEAGMSVLCLDAGRDSGSDANAGSLHGQMQSRMERQFPERVENYRHTLPIYPRAIDYWARIAGRLGEDIEFRYTGGFMIAESAGQMAALERKSRIEGEHGVHTRPMGREELLGIAPYLNPGVHGALFCEKEGKVNPLL